MHSQGRVPPNLKCSLPRTECLVAQAVSCPKVSGQGGKSWTLLTEWCAPLQGYMPPEKGISFFFNLYKSGLCNRGSHLCELWMWSSPQALSFLAAHERPGGSMVPIAPGGSEIAAVVFSG